MTAFTVEEWVSLMEKAKVANATDDTSGTDVIGTVPEDRIAIPLVFVISDTSGAANTVDIAFSGEATGTIHANFNLGASETRVLSAEELATIVPNIQGGADINITAGSDGVEVTLVYVENIEV